MQEDFELETVLSITTGINFANDYGDVLDLYSFILEDDFISEENLLMLHDTVKRHILAIHPELNYVRFNPNIDIDKWLSVQKSIFGQTLTISVLGEKVVKLEKQSYVSLR